MGDRRSAGAAVLMGLAVWAGVEARQSPGLDAGLVAALRAGGLVLVMRHANAPATLPDARTAHPGNDALERQLSDNGRRAAEEMGRTIRALGIRVGRLSAGPSFRTRETARYLALGRVETDAAFGEGPAPMQAIGDVEVQALRRAVGRLPPNGTNTLVVTHSPNIAAAFSEARQPVAEGEVLVFKPDGQGTAVLVGRVRIEDWSRLAPTGR